MLLLCPELPYFLWVGTGFDFSETGIDAEQGDDYLLRWAASIQPGEVQFDSTVGKFLDAESLSIIRYSIKLV